MSIASSWNDEYRKGRYAGEPPLPFASEILKTLERYPSVRRGIGLYVGCGNGRNYLPLVDAGLDLVGLDLSSEAIRQLAEARPELKKRHLVCTDFRGLPIGEYQFDYLIAIQIFQHGNELDAATYFQKSAALIRPGGLLFVRVNSVATQIHHPHPVIEYNSFGGVTIRYEVGPKRGLLVHFYSHDELDEHMKSDFAPVLELQEIVTERHPSTNGSWSQWEGVWKRNPA